MKEIITNGASFEQAQNGAVPADWPALGASTAQPPGRSQGKAKPAVYRLVVHPWHNTHHESQHCCAMCPENLCKVIHTIPHTCLLPPPVMHWWLMPWHCAMLLSVVVW